MKKKNQQTPYDFYKDIDNRLKEINEGKNLKAHFDDFERTLLSVAADKILWEDNREKMDFLLRVEVMCLRYQKSIFAQLILQSTNSGFTD